MNKSILAAVDVYGDPGGAVGGSGGAANVAADRVQTGSSPAIFFLGMIGLLVAIRVLYELAGENL